MSTNNPLYGKTVLVTRPAGQGADFADALRAHGAHAMLAPAIAIAPPDDPVAAARAVDEAGTFAWVVFTSANGVRAFFERLDERREDARSLRDAKVAAIGIKTARALRERGIYADLVPQTYVAEDLADALVAAAQPGDAILIFRAQEARDVLPLRLQAGGLDAHVVAAYKTSFANDPEFAEKVAASDILTFTSASTVRGFVHNFGTAQAAARAADGKIVACIGPITAREAQQAGLRVDAVAKEYTVEGLIRAMEQPASA